MMSQLLALFFLHSEQTTILSVDFGIDTVCLISPQFFCTGDDSAFGLRMTALYFTGPTVSVHILLARGEQCTSSQRGPTYQADDTCVGLVLG